MNNHSIQERRSRAIRPKSSFSPPYVTVGNVRDYNIERRPNGEIIYTQPGREIGTMYCYNAVYCGRTPRFGGPSILANPFRAGKDGTRDHVVDVLYRQHLWKLIESKQVTVDDLKRLAGHTLLCHCKPLKCHCDVIASAVRWALDQ